jgi:pimeloyl-ACP methyl ester carboxylesterase
VSEDIVQRVVNTERLNFGTLQCGTGPLALCLHGFPDSAHSWRHLLPRLADAGYHAVAPFMRGYAPTPIPEDGAYQTCELGLDAIALHEALDADEHAVVIGHDWGATAAYAAAIIEPRRWSKVVGMSVPPWGAMTRAFLGNLEQIRRSWYMFYFQHPLADLVVPANDLAFIDMIWNSWSPGFDSVMDARNAKDCLTEPANLQAALGYYRATLGNGYRNPANQELQQRVSGDQPPQPTLYLHGLNDGCIGIEVARDAARNAPDSASVLEIHQAGHFIQLEQPNAVAEAILGFLEKQD